MNWSIPNLLDDDDFTSISEFLEDPAPDPSPPAPVNTTKSPKFRIKRIRQVVEEKLQKNEPLLKKAHQQEYCNILAKQYIDDNLEDGEIPEYTDKCVCNNGWYFDMDTMKRTRGCVECNMGQICKKKRLCM